nr:peptidoglycan-associated lipoprotein Pal [Enterovirga rhinocerotis]
MPNARRAALKLVTAASLALSIAACSSTPDQLAGGAGGSGGNRYGAGGYGAGGAGGPATPGSARDFAVNVGDRVFFESDSSDLTSTAVATLDRQAQWLQRYSSHSFVVEGHADERGTREYNYSLGARRAQTVRDYLASRGVPSSRIRTVSYGKERPVAVCNDISCWSQNRRAVTALEGGNS